MALSQLSYTPNVPFGAGYQLALVFNLASAYADKSGGTDGIRTRDPGVTGRYSNQLNYRSAVVSFLTVFLTSSRSFEPPSRGRDSGGRGEARTPDIHLVRVALSQLSYTPNVPFGVGTSLRWLSILLQLALKVAERTGFEPATPGVTGRYSNQLNYRSAVVSFLTVFLTSSRSFEPPSRGRDSGGRGEARTPDIHLVRVALSQLSYTPNVPFGVGYQLTLAFHLASACAESGGTDGIRTRDPRRDRPVF